jgi:elongation factor Ts
MEGMNMTITASMVAELRGKTDAPMMECKKALTEAAGDMAKAEEILRVKLGNKAGKAASRITAEGVVTAYIDGTTAGLIEVNCETDFVTKNDSFLGLCNAAAKAVVTANPADVAALGATAFSLDGFGPTLEDVRKGLIGKIGENMSFRRFKRFASGSAVTTYLHGTRIGVAVEFDGNETAARDVAMHIAAMKPVSLSGADVPADLVAKERSIAEQKAAESGKPADIIAKMVEGSVQKYLKEVSLMDQVFVKAADGKQTVAAYLKSANTTVKSFTLYVVGEGIEKKVDDFAAEVAAQVAAAKGA